MENVLNFSPVQTIFLLFIYAWTVVIFPVVVIRKLNYIAELLESQFQDEPPEQPSP